MRGFDSAQRAYDNATPPEPGRCECGHEADDHRPDWLGSKCTAARCKCAEYTEGNPQQDYEDAMIERAERSRE